MTVAELIEKLQQHEPSMRVVTWCDYGFNDVDSVSHVKIALNVYNHAASHGEVDDREDYPDNEHVNAVSLTREV